MVRRATCYEALSLAIRQNSVKYTKYILRRSNGLVIHNNWTDYLLLIKTLQRGHRKIVKLLLKENCRVNKIENTNFFHTPLYYATRLGDVDLVRMLLSKGALINGRDFNKDTSLCLALKMKYYKIVDIMLSHYLNQVLEIYVSSQNSDDTIAFSAACLRNKERVVEEFIRRGMTVNIHLDSSLHNAFNCTPLHIAVKHQNLEVIHVLLKNGANFTAKNGLGQTPLHLAYYMREKCYPYKDCCKIIDILLAAFESRATPNPLTEDNLGLSSFHIACTRDQIDIIKYFLHQGVDVNKSVYFDSPTCAGYTPLHFAIENRHKNVVELLLEHGASTIMKNMSGQTPFHLAFSFFYSDHDFLDSILNKYVPKNVNPINNFGLSHLHIACTTRNTNAIESFLENHADAINKRVNFDASKCPGYTPLHFAVDFNRKEAVEILLQHNVDINLKDKNGFTPLHLACQQNAKKIHTILRNSLSPIMFEIINSDHSLFFFKESPTISTKHKVIDLDLIAKQTMQVEIVDLLLRHKSDLDSQDEFGKTPLFYACDIDHKTFECAFGKNMTQYLHKILNLFYIKRSQILETLLRYKPHVNIYDNNGKTVLHYVAEIDKPFGDDKKAEVATVLLDNGADVNARNKTGLTPLHIALKKGYVDLVEVLLKYNVDPNIAEYENFCTALHLATFNDFLAPKSEEIVSALISKGADVDRRQLDGKTSLHIAASTRFSTSRLIPLLEVDCDIDCQDSKGKTALHMACLNRNPDNVQNLLRHGADFNITDRYGRTAFFYFYEYQIEVLECRRTIYNFHQIYYIFKDHIRRLKSIDFYVSWENMSYYMKLKDLHRQQQVNNVENDILLKCEYEVKKMKSIKLNSYSTLYDILFKDPNEMALYVENENFKNIVQASNFKSEFPQYRYLLELQLRKGKTRSELMNPAKEALEFILGVSLPDACSERIFRYLCNRNLKDLIKAQNSHN
ncbi:ankyrin-3 [Nasonia vitripennis]|uniref:Uncharacterized protein n=1 Tax=Nasonia vitripennis TaxID=7425 RepID=A0A7M7G4R3_NASVI|nr:ankyrin-3 [Nasonia vitripennis]